MEGDAHIDRKETTFLEGSSLPSILETSIQSASSSKVSNTIFDLDTTMCDTGRTDISRNRIFDITILVGVLEWLGCPDSKENNVTLSEVDKFGSAIKVQLSCTCLWTHEFWSSKN